VSTALDLNGSIDEITEQLLGHYPARPKSPRRIGREIEVPVVDPDGRAADVAVLWPSLLELSGSAAHHDDGVGGKPFVSGVERPYGLVTVEFGRSILEVALEPADGLGELRRSAGVALEELAAVARAHGLLLIGMGMQPRSAATKRQLTPKERYVDLVESVGPLMLRATGSAADQVHVDVARSELLAALNSVNGLAGAVIALSANSPLHAGRHARGLASREAYLAEAFHDPNRWGSTPERFAGIDGYVRHLVSFRPLQTAGEASTPWEQFEERNRYVFPSGRAVFRYGTVEVRPACQQPFDSFWVPAALGLGIVANAAAADEWLEASGASWAALMAYRKRAVKQGLQAREPFEGFLEGVLGLAQEGLVNRGQGEEEFLTDAWDRLAARRTPADEIIDLLSEQGMEGVIRARAF
jgi:gamma-glutamylcysteine synthetase